MSKIGTADIKGIMLGSTEISKAYLGSDVVYQKSNPLPYDAEVEYLQSSGTQYIDTAIIPTDHQTICRFAFTAKTGYVCGAFNANNCRYYPCTSSGNYLYLLNPDNSRVYRSTYNTSIHNLDFNGESHNCYWDGTNVGKTTAMPSPSQMTSPIYLFGISASGALSNPAKVKIYSCKIYARGGSMVRDYIPVRVGQVGYMYDRVYGQLYGNQGTGSFILGADKN